MRILLIYFALPVWLAAGFGDYLCHRRTRIEATSGVPECVSHVAQYLLVAIPVFSVLWLEVGPLLVSLVVSAAIAHTAVAFWDISYTNERRYVSPLEQHIHSYLEMFPLFAAALLVFAWYEPDVGQAARPDWDLAVHKRVPGPSSGTVLVVVCGMLLAGIAVAEEFWRAWKAQS